MSHKPPLKPCHYTIPHGYIPNISSLSEVSRSRCVIKVREVFYTHLREALGNKTLVRGQVGEIST